MDQIIEKLKKLINHERSAREIGNVEEAAAFAAKILDHGTCRLFQLQCQGKPSTELFEKCKLNRS